jgi:hypothetical protein
VIKEINWGTVREEGSTAAFLEEETEGSTFSEFSSSRVFVIFVFAGVRRGVVVTFWGRRERRLDLRGWLAMAGARVLDRR